MGTHRLLGISGSLRAGSLNTLLVREAARVFGAAELTMADLRLPLYDGDEEALSGIPESVQRLADQISAADAVLVSTPEYNKGLSGVLKNALDWVSRTKSKPWVGKPVALLSATGGRAGGERAQTMLRSCLVPFQPHIVAGPEVLIGGGAKQFDEAGRLVDERAQTALAGLMERLRAEIARSVG